MAVQPPATSVDLDRIFRAHATALLRLGAVLTGDRLLAEVVSRSDLCTSDARAAD